MAGTNSIPTPSIKHPSSVSQTSANYDLLIKGQLLAPIFWSDYVRNFGEQNYTTFLKTFAGMEKVNGKNYFHFEERGKLMEAFTVKTTTTGTGAGNNIVVPLDTIDHYDAGTKSAVRVGESVMLASNSVEGKIVSINTTVANAHTATIRPSKSTVAFASAGSANLLAGDVVKLMSNSDAGEASSNISPLIPLDERIDNSLTTIRDDWRATDFAEMAETYYKYEEDGGFMSAGISRGKQGAFTYKGLVKTGQRFMNNVAFKLLYGGQVNNTGLPASETGTKGMIPEITARGGVITYALGGLGIAKLHQITDQLEVNGNPSQNQWLMDIKQRQEIDDDLFAQYPQGAYVWGSGSATENASVAYGFDNFKIDNYMLQLKKEAGFNTEAIYGKTPLVDDHRNFGIIIPQGARETKFGNGGSMGGINTGKIKNLQVMYQEPLGGGTIANGIKVWEFGGEADSNMTGTLEKVVSMVTYQGMRTAGLNQFMNVVGS